jgi:hypothetical protein
MSWSLGVVCDDMRVLLDAWRAFSPLLPPSDHLRLEANARRTHLDDGRPIWILRLGHPAAWVGCGVRDLPFSSPRPYLLHATRVPDSHADGHDLRA